MVIVVIMFVIFCATALAENEPIINYQHSENRLNEYNYKWVLNVLIISFKGLNDKCFFFKSFETSDGISRQEEGHLIDQGTDNEGISVRGSYSYIGDDNKIYTVNYIADRNGFQPQGDHLPIPLVRQ